jgi:hypothetical protein
MPATDVFVGSFQTLWSGFAAIVPQIAFAIILLIFGWIVAMFLEQVVSRLLKVVKLNDYLEKAGALEGLKKAEVKFDASAFLSGIVRWFVFFVFLMAVADLLGLSAFNAFLTSVLLYVPNIVLAALILLVTAIAADLLDRVVSGSVRAAGFSYGSMVGSLARWSVFVFGFIAALQQLGIATDLLQTLVTGIVAMIAIAGGLAFGLGGKELAADVLDNVRRRVS